jgi:broad specificity phosphatase PhoE
MTDERLAERSRGELDASLWPTSRLEIERPAEAMRKAAYPAAWKPPQGESYADVNHRLKHLLKDIAARKIPRQPTILFTSREVALASLAESGLGYMSDQDFITGLKGEHGDSISTLRLENAGIVAYHDLKGAGHFTHFEIHQPVWQKDGSIVNDPIVMRTGKLSLPKHR